MNFNSITQKMKDFVTPIDEEVVEYEEEEVEPISEYEKPKSKAVSRLTNDTKMVLFEPRSYEEIDEVAMRIKENRAVVVNFQKVTRETAQRSIDFLSGVTFALDGAINKIGANVIMCTPKTMGIHGEIENEGDEE